MNQLHELVTITIREHQRKVPIRGYNASHLLTIDPPAYKGPDGARGKMPDAAAPLADGERWVDDGWRVSIGEATDADGWRYARTFGSTGHARKGVTDVCRWREWTRAKKAPLELDTGLPTAEAPPPPPPSPLRPEVAPEKAFARAMAMAPADRHARIVALAMQISVSDAGADAMDRATKTLTAEEKTALEAEASSCQREAASHLAFAQKLEGDAAAASSRDLKLAAAAAATARGATARKRLALPGYDPSCLIRGEDGLCIGVKDATLERCAGRIECRAEPTEAGARVEISARGDDDDGAAVELVVEGLVIISGRGSRIPTVRVRRVALKARVTWSATVAFAAGQWTVKAFQASIKRWSAPGVLSRTAARAVLKLVLPTLREGLRSRLPPELGEFFASLRGPFMAEGSLDVRATPTAAVASAPLDGDSPEASEARKLVGWTRDQALGFAEGRNALFAGRPKKELPPMASLADVAAYLRRHEPPPTPPAAEARTPRERSNTTNGDRPVGASWTEAAAVLSASVPAGQRWQWAELAGAATRLRRHPCEISLRIPTVAGAVPLRLAHNLFWQYQARSVASAGSDVAAQNIALLRERGASNLALLADKIRCAQGTVSLHVDDGRDSVLRVISGTVESPAPKAFDARSLIVRPEGDIPYEVRARPYSEMAVDAVTFDEPRVPTPTQFNEDESDEDDNSGNGAATPPRPPPAAVEPVIVDGTASGSVAGSPDDDGVAVEICRGGDAWLSAAVRKATISLEATGTPVTGTAAVGRLGVGGFSVEVNQGLALVLSIADGAICGRTTGILRELAHVFGDAEALRSWWPGPVDGASCEEAVQVLDLLQINGIGEGKFRLAVDLAGTLRKDDDDLILAGTATQGVRVDAAVNARDVLLDASILGDAIRRRRLLEAAASIC